MTVLPSSISRSSALPTPWPWCSGSTKRSARRVTPERSTMPPKPTVLAVVGRGHHHADRSRAGGGRGPTPKDRAGTAKRFSARLGRDHSATRCGRRSRHRPATQRREASSDPLCNSEPAEATEIGERLRLTYPAATPQRFEATLGPRPLPGRSALVHQLVDAMRGEERFWSRTWTADAPRRADRARPRT